MKIIRSLIIFILISLDVSGNPVMSGPGLPLPDEEPLVKTSEDLQIDVFQTYSHITGKFEFKNGYIPNITYNPNASFRVKLPVLTRKGIAYDHSLLSSEVVPKISFRGSSLSFGKFEEYHLLDDHLSPLVLEYCNVYALNFDYMVDCNYEFGGGELVVDYRQNHIPTELGELIVYITNIEKDYRSNDNITVEHTSRFLITIRNKSDRKFIRRSRNKLVLKESERAVSRRLLKF